MVHIFKSIRKALLVFFTFIIYTQIISANRPVTETRAVWLTTNWGLDWPKQNSSPEEQKKQLCRILDELQNLNFNTVFFQARVRGDVFYKSAMEPWSPYFQRNTRIGAPATYDPLKFAIEECHKRGLECHAWLVTYPLGSKQQVKEHGKNSVVARYPQLCKLYHNEWYLDPGNPDTDEYLLRIIDEIVSNYDVDGIHFDYIRYPDAAKKFPDNATYSKFAKKQPLDDWRRSNITRFVTSAYDLIKAKKPWVQVSCSPIGRYKDLNPANGGWTAYSSVYQDAGKWIREGIMDAIYPMMYFKGQAFSDYANQWKENSAERIIAPGIGAYKLLKNEGDWNLSDITTQLDDIKNQDLQGAAYFRAGNIIDNAKGLKNKLNEYYQYQAKLPALSWIDNESPNSPSDIQVYRDTNGLVVIEWQSTDPNEEQTYTVYESDSEDFDINNVRSIITTRIRANKLYIDTPDIERGVYYAITASDRYHNESVPSFPVFFVLSTRLEK